MSRTFPPRPESRSSANPRSLAIERLEARQLMAVVQGGDEVRSNVSRADGSVYDEVLMTGQAVEVRADPGQGVRVVFLDPDGDLVQVDYSGAGWVSIAMPAVDDPVHAGTPSAYVGNVMAERYLPSNVRYVQGVATISVGVSNASSNLAITSVGPANGAATLFDSTHQGGNHLADLARILLVGNPSNPAGFSNFGSLEASNVHFSDVVGFVGIIGKDVAVQGTVSIGDIEAYESGVPTLSFNSNSQFQTVWVRGGDLQQPNGTSFNTFGGGDPGAPGGSPGGPLVSLGGFAFFNSTNAQDSAGTTLWAHPVNQDAIRLAAVDQQTIMGGDWSFALDASGTVTAAWCNGTDVTAGLIGSASSAQDSLDAAFDRRTFLGNVAIVGDLPANLEIKVAEVRGSITFHDDLFGSFIVDGYGAGVDGTLWVKGDLDGHVLVRGIDRVAIATDQSLGAGQRSVGDGQVNRINALVVEGSTGPFADIRAEEIGYVRIGHDFSGLIGTNVWSAAPTVGLAALPLPSTTDNTGDGATRTGSGAVDFDGSIGKVVIGYAAEGTNNGGSIVNGSVVGLSGIGAIKVGGDIHGSPTGTGVFVTGSRSGAAPTDVRNHGSANIGTLTVHGDVDLDSSSTRLLHIAGNGTYGAIVVEGVPTVAVVLGDYTDSTFAPHLVAGSEQLVRILSPFLDAGFVPDAARGQALLNNYDSDRSGPLTSDYRVTAADVAAGAKVVTVGSDGSIGAPVAAQVGDRVPALSGGQVVRDAFGNVLYVQNTALVQGLIEIVETKHYGPGVTTILSGDRGNLDGVSNNFGRIEIAGLLGAQQSRTGTIRWTDSVDMTFGGVTVNSAGLQNQGVVASAGVIGAITIRNTGGAQSDLQFTGVIGSPLPVSSSNDRTAFVALDALSAAGFEDVVFERINADPAQLDRNAIVHVTSITNGVTVSTVAGVGNGTGVGTVSPSVTFHSRLLLDDGTTEGAQQAGLVLATGIVNSTIRFGEASGIIVDDGGSTGNLSSIAPLTLSADYVEFAGVLSAHTIAALVLTGATGIGSHSDTAVSFTGTILADSVAGVAAAATEGNVVFAPGAIAASSAQIARASIGAVSLSTIGSANGGDLTFGSGATYAADFAEVLLTAGHSLYLSQAGTVLDNPGHIAIDCITTGNLGALIATTTTGTITNALVVQGDVMAITYKAGAAVVGGGDALRYEAGPVGDLVRAGSIVAAQTIWGTRGVTTMEVAGRNADGSAATLDFTVNGVDYSILPAGTIAATLRYAGASTATGDALLTRTGLGATEVSVQVIGHDRNANGVIARSEFGHGGSANLQSVAGDIAFSAFTPTPGTFADGQSGVVLAAVNGRSDLHGSTFGNVVVRTGSHAGANGSLTGTGGGIGDIALRFDDWTAGNVQASTGAGFDGQMGSLAATTTAGDITFLPSKFDHTVGNVSLTAGVVTDGTGTITAGNVTIGTDSAHPVLFEGNRGVFSATATDVGRITAFVQADGPTTVGGNAFVFAGQYGKQTIGLSAASYDINNNGLLTAGEYARTGDVSVSSLGGDVALTLDAHVFTSAQEQAAIGAIAVTNQRPVQVQAVSEDHVGNVTPDGRAIADATGAITIVGAATQVGAVGNVTATINAGYEGDIALTGTFGDLGQTTLSTSSYFDAIAVPNVFAQAPRFHGAGAITLDDLSIRGTRGLITATTVDNGSIQADSIRLGGGLHASAAGHGFAFRTDFGAIATKITATEFDRSGNLGIEAGELGSAGTVTAASVAGTITLELATDVSDSGLAAQSSIPGLTFGAITATTGDSYDTGKGEALASNLYRDGATRGYLAGAVSATAADTPAQSGSIRITGSGADATNAFVPFGGGAPATLTGNRGTVGDVTASAVRGEVRLDGVFNHLGAAQLTANTYLDTLAGGVNPITGSITFGGAGTFGSGGALTIAGTAGTATLSTGVGLGAATSGASSGGGIGGNVFYGGVTAASAIVATTQASDIALEVTAAWYDADGNSLVTDLSSQPFLVVPIDEFAHVGTIRLLSQAVVNPVTNGNLTAGDVFLGLAAGTTNGSIQGSSIGDVAASSGDTVAVELHGPDSVTAGNVTITGRSPAAAGTVGAIVGTVQSGTVTLDGAFGATGTISLNTGAYVDTTGNSGSVQVGGAPVGSGLFGHLLAAGDIVFAGALTGAGAVTLTAGGAIDNDGRGAAGNITLAPDFGGAWDDANHNHRVDAGELDTAASVPITATATDGTITFAPTADAQGFGSAMRNVTLLTTGTSTYGSTGDIVIGNGGVSSFAAVSDFNAGALSGDVTFLAGTDWQAPTITNFTLSSRGGNGATPHGDVTMAGHLSLNFANATNNQATSGAITGVTLEAANGNVGVAGGIRDRLATALEGYAKVATSTDNRTFAIDGLRLLAGNGGADDDASNGVITVASSGSLGHGANLTRIDGLVLTNGGGALDTTTLGGDNVLAANVGVVTFNGAAFLGLNAIVADDSGTARTHIGTVAYRDAAGAPIVSNATTPGQGSLLGRIDGLVFNGPVQGTGAGLITGATANIRASQIGNISIEATVDPHAAIDWSVQGLNVWAGPQAGEKIADTAAHATATGYSRIDAFSLGGVYVTHHLAGTEAGSRVFAGSNAFLALGKMGDIRVDSVVTDSYGVKAQAPLFGSAGGAAWFVVGDPNATLATPADDLVALKALTTDGAAFGKTPNGVLHIGDSTADRYQGQPIADVWAHAAASSAANDDLANLSGGAAGTSNGFTVAAGVLAGASGNYASGATAISPERTKLSGHLHSVEFRNGAFTPDKSTVSLTAPAPGTNAAVVVAGDGSQKADIDDMVNEVLTDIWYAGTVAMDSKQYYVVGDAAPVGVDSLIVYVL
ncbi:MAG: hypothetical protein IPL39_14785 [Opitutaceae bacterium]|nr:hypothetical protein [Opitutaceae bacterium]